MYREEAQEKQSREGRQGAGGATPGCSPLSLGVRHVPGPVLTLSRLVHSSFEVGTGITSIEQGQMRPRDEATCPEAHSQEVAELG